MGARELSLRHLYSSLIPRDAYKFQDQKLNLQKAPGSWPSILLVKYICQMKKREAENIKREEALKRMKIWKG